MQYYEALKECLNGKKIAREDWNGKRMFVYYVPGRQVHISEWEGYATETEKERGYVIVHGHFDMYNAQGERIIGWSATQTDMASDRWVIINDTPADEIYEDEREEHARNMFPN